MKSWNLSRKLYDQRSLSIWGIHSSLLASSSHLSHEFALLLTERKNKTCYSSTTVICKSHVIQHRITIWRTIINCIRGWQQLHSYMHHKIKMLWFLLFSCAIYSCELAGNWERWEHPQAIWLVAQLHNSNTLFILFSNFPYIADKRHTST